MAKKIFALFFSCAMLVGCLGLTGCGRSGGENGVVNVYNWGEYIEEELLDEFTELTGIKVNYDTYASNESLYSIL